MDLMKRKMIQIAAAGLLFLAGAVTGSVATQHTAAVNKFGQPKTVIHIVAYKFRDATSQNDQEQAIAGIKEYGRQNSRHQEHLAENGAKPDTRLERRLRYRIHQRRGRRRLRGKPDSRCLAKEVGAASRDQCLVSGVQLIPDRTLGPESSTRYA